MAVRMARPASMFTPKRLSVVAAFMRAIESTVQRTATSVGRASVHPCSARPPSHLCAWEARPSGSRPSLRRRSRGSAAQPSANNARSTMCRGSRARASTARGAPLAAMSRRVPASLGGLPLRAPGRRRAVGCLSATNLFIHSI